jgi:hypothetical protein
MKNPVLALLIDALDTHPEALGLGLAQPYGMPTRDTDLFRLVTAILAGHKEKVLSLLRARPELVNLSCVGKDREAWRSLTDLQLVEGMTPLFVAMGVGLETGKWDIFDAVRATPGIDLSPMAVTPQGHDYNVLMWAVWNKKKGIHPLKALLQQGANAFSHNPVGESAFTLALWDLAKMTFLAINADTPLSRSSQNTFRGLVEVMDLILQYDVKSDAGIGRRVMGIIGSDGFWQNPGADAFRDLLRKQKLVGPIPGETYQEVLFGWLLERGVDVPELHKVLHTRLPGFYARQEKTSLETGLPAPGLSASPSRSRI